MKNRRIAIIAFVLVAVMAIGVGYAALTDNMKVTGAATAKDAGTFDAKVVFVSATKKSGTDGVTVSNGAIDPTQDILDLTLAGFEKLNDTITVTVTVKNDSDLDAVIDNMAFTDVAGKYFEASHTLADDTAIAAGASITFDVTVTCIQTPDDPVNGNTENLTLTFDVIAEAA